MWCAVLWPAGVGTRVVWRLPRLRDDAAEWSTQRAGATGGGAGRARRARPRQPRPPFQPHGPGNPTSLQRVLPSKLYAAKYAGNCFSLSFRGHVKNWN